MKKKMFIGKIVQITGYIFFLTLLIAPSSAEAYEEGKVYTDADIGNDRIKTRSEKELEEREYQDMIKKNREYEYEREKNESKQRISDAHKQLDDLYTGCLTRARESYQNGWDNACRTYRDCSIYLNRPCPPCELPTDIILILDSRLAAARSDCHAIYKNR